MSRLDLDRFTDRQRAAWPDAVAEAQRYVGSDTIGSQWWIVTYAEESRPGRGHDIDAAWCDGEHLVQIRLDPYGRESVSVGEVTWLHSSADEECECGHCTAERDEGSGGSDDS